MSGYPDIRQEGPRTSTGGLPLRVRSARHQTGGSPHRHGGVAHDPLARLVDVGACGQVHGGVRAPDRAPLQLLHLLQGVAMPCSMAEMHGCMEYHHSNEGRVCLRWRRKGQMLRAANDRYTQDASSAIGGGIGCGRQQDGQGSRAVVYLLDGRADGRVADVGVDLHKEGAACQRSTPQPSWTVAFLCMQVLASTQRLAFSSPA